MIERKSEAFIIVMTGFLLEHQDHSKFRYAGSNRNKTNGDIVITRVPSLSNYRSTFFRNTQALGDVKRLLPNDPAQYLTAVRILTLLVHFWYLLLLTYVWQADNYIQDNTLLLTFTWQPAIDASTLTFKTHLKPSSRRMRANYHFKSGEQGVSLS